MPLPQLPYPVKLLEMPRDRELLPFDASSAPMRHPIPTLGYRFAVEGKVIVYCPDIGYCPEAVSLERGADLLLAECASRIGEDHPEWPHLNPEIAARIAQEAGSKQLALVHFDASRYADRESRIAAERLAQSLHPNTVAAFDGACLTF